MSFILHLPLDSIIESVIAVGGVSLWVSSVAVYFILSTSSTSKGEGTSAIREMIVEPKGREGREKCFPTFLLQ